MAVTTPGAPVPPEADLSALEAQHREEERLEAERDLITSPRPMGSRLPQGGRLPQSQAWLDRLYEGDRVVREKKPAVFDHLRSYGPWFVSVDDEPLSVLDGMSQTATIPGGFSADPVMRAWVEGDFGDVAVQTTDTSVQQTKEGRRFASVLQHLVPGLPQVSFTNSGAEANEKALALCRLYSPRPEARKVLAFEGGFHGRTLLALHATANPAKRGPFEISGYEATFAPYPVWSQPLPTEPPEPPGFLETIASGQLASLAHLAGAVEAADAADEDPVLLALEVRSLLAVDEALSSGEYFACIVEPMQSEGGDRYATARFFRALRVLTRVHDVPLIFDEVQTGFGLGGSFAWHRQFALVDETGRPTGPDAVTFAKRAQVGVCMSRFTDPEPTGSHPASMVRGRIHAQMVDPGQAREVERVVQARLRALATRFPDLVLQPRSRGYAIAFDLPSPDLLAVYLTQRFYRGAIVFGAGDRTVRYRLSSAFNEPEIHQLFDAIRRTLSWMEQHPGETPPAWEVTDGELPSVAEDVEIRVREVQPHERQRVFERVVELEAQVFEAARRDPAHQLRHALDDPTGVSLVAEARRDGIWQMVGFALAVPLEKAFEVPGPDEDVMLGRENTLYSRTITVDPAYQGLGLGRTLKAAQLAAAARRRRPDGSRRYLYCTGRNRVGATDAMMRINRQHGAHTVQVIDHQYETPDGQALYYRIPLGPIAPDRPPFRRRPTYDELDLSVGIGRPFARVPRGLLEAEAEGRLTGPALNKITLCNYVTPATVRAVEWIGALAPLPHLYLTSSRDEMVDKALRILRWHRKGAQVAVGLEGGYVGHTTAAARSLSDPGVHHAGPPHFQWPRVPHPADVGVEASLSALRQVVSEAGGGQAVFGLFLELVQERTGRVIPETYWPGLDALRKELDLPVVLVETTTACYRGGTGAFALDPERFLPDLMAWWGGGQTGYVHVSDRYFVDKPLTMVSTWDGDELSLLRDHQQLLAARRLELRDAIAAYDAALAPLAEAGFQVHGQGLYRVIHAGQRADQVAEAFFSRGIRIRRFPGGRLALVPPLDAVLPGADRLARAIKELV